MAFVRKKGNRYTVHHGGSGEQLSSFPSRKEADEEVRKLHAKNKPKSSNRGGTASKKFEKGSSSNLMKKKKKK